MRKIIFIVALIGALASFSFIDFQKPFQQPVISDVTAQDSVYICDSKSAYVYHKNEYCSGLNRCTHGVLKVSLKDAENSCGRRACKVCY